MVAVILDSKSDPLRHSGVRNHEVNEAHPTNNSELFAAFPSQGITRAVRRSPDILLFRCKFWLYAARLLMFHVVRNHYFTTSIMVAFDMLPEELIDNIFATLKECQPDARTLAGISLVSKRFHRIVEPHLYSDIAIKSKRMCAAQLSGNIHALYKILIVRPNLAKHIKRVTFRSDNGIHLQDEFIRMYNGQENDRARYSSDLMLRAAETMTDTLLTALTWLLPNIQCLDLRQHAWSTDDSFRSFTGTIARRMPYLTLKLNVSQNISLKSFDYVLHSLPLHTLHLSGEDIGESEIKGTGLLSHVRHLILDGFNQSFGAILMITKRCTYLEWLTMHLETYHSHEMNGSINPIDELDYVFS